MSFRTICLFILFVSLSAAASSPGGGGREGHGGDTLVLNFAGTMANILDAIESANLVKENPGCSAVEIGMLRRLFGNSEAAINLPDAKDSRMTDALAQRTYGTLTLAEKASRGATYVFSVPDIVLDDRRIEDATNQWDAWNRPSIRLSRRALLELNDPVLYAELVLHEYYGLFDIEPTNAFTRSHTCIQSLIERGFSADRLVYREQAITSIERQFFAGDGRTHLICHDGKSNYAAFSRYRPGRGVDVFFALDHGHGWYESVGAARFPGRLPEDLVARMRLDYAVDTGIGTIHWQGGLDDGGSAALSTVDHIDWQITLADGSGRVRKLEHCSVNDAVD